MLAQPLTQTDIPLDTIQSVLAHLNEPEESSSLELAIPDEILFPRLIDL
jgi:hypothetical protein